MAQFVTGAAKLVAGKHIENFAHQFEPEDPYYEYYEDHGRMRRRKRPMPPGLTKKEEKILLKIKKRAHHLDKGFRLCGMRFGWTFIIGLVPFAGDIADALLSHNLIVKKAQQIDDIPEQLIRQMVMNNTMSAAMGFIPVVGDLASATFKTNSRNAKLVEEFLRKRGEAHTAGTSTSTATASGYAASSQGPHPAMTTNTPQPSDHEMGWSTSSVPPPPPPRR
ncbi:Similar to S.cerevisiae protein YLR326W (Putative protein of unknown function) [Malassezia sympodialis ATCC 42132]|uniref:Uncharacterized protein n=1 Tax=Malassezia sympodialis (strain ATCC 42132) TaxID=1230383 RepID=A0A1M8A2V3_MALS4|nr:Similar to S.cerevisiae protein YLR326W (Putative protein of unknown function) [Malassezia sympodialis ATCC 42132]